MKDPIVFQSDCHTRTPFGSTTGETFPDCHRAIVLVTSRVDEKVYEMCLVNLDTNYLLMVPKHMSITHEDDHKVKLDGVGVDEKGQKCSPFSLSFTLSEEGIPTSATLVFRHREARLDYTKSTELLAKESDLVEFATNLFKGRIPPAPVRISADELRKRLLMEMLMIKETCGFQFAEPLIIDLAKDASNPRIAEYAPSVMRLYGRLWTDYSRHYSYLCAFGLLVDTEEHEVRSINPQYRELHPMEMPPILQEFLGRPVYYSLFVPQDLPRPDARYYWFIV